MKSKQWLCGNPRLQIDRGDKIVVGLDATKGMEGAHY